MKKQLIVGGCSFTFGRPNWATELAEYLKNQNNELTFVSTSFPSQGQDMIQKKVMLAIMEAFDNGILPEELLVVVMWSGIGRKSWYIDNSLLIDKLDPDSVLQDLKNLGQDKGAGWHSSVHGSHVNDKNLEFPCWYYLFDQYPNGVGKVHDSLENIINLQNFCKLHGVTLIQQFFMNDVFENIEKHQEHQIINYLYKQLDFSRIIKQGMLDYIETFLNIPDNKSLLSLTPSKREIIAKKTDLLMSDGCHPGKQGVKLWCENILLPFIKNYI